MKDEKSIVINIDIKHLDIVYNLFYILNII